MSKRLRTSKPTTGEVVEVDNAMAPAILASPSFVSDEKAVRTGATATRPRSSSASSTTSSNGAMANGKGKGSAATENPANKHVMLPAFLSKTYEIFCMPEFASICGWNASGDTIIVSQLEAFVAMVLPRFFKHRNFPSFVRQLNLYGFHKTVLDSKRLEFQHPYFKRDRPDLLHYIKRKVSTGPTPTQQQTVSRAFKSSRLEVHREISDQLLKEMKDLRQRSDTMEKRLRELEIDNAIVRSDNMKLWKHLENAKDKQLIMHEKMKKIMWILFQIYRGKQGIPKLGGHGQEDAITEDYINSSRLGPKEFRDVLRFLAMDEPALLPNSSTATVDSTALNARKRKFVEVPSTDPSFGDDLFKLGPSTVEEIGSPVRDAAVAGAALPNRTSMADSVPSNVLSIFSPQVSVPRLTPADPTTQLSVPRPLSNVNSAPLALSDISNRAMTSAPSTALTTTTSGTATPSDAAYSAMSNLDFMDDELPLLNDTEHYPFSEGEEQQVMRRLEDFESSLLDEYDVGCLDTLLQQLKAANAEKPAITLPSMDAEEIVPSPSDNGARTSA